MPQMRAASTCADVGGIGIRDAERRSPKMRSANFSRPRFDLTGAGKVGSKRWGGSTLREKLSPTPPPVWTQGPGRGASSRGGVRAWGAWAVRFSNCNYGSTNKYRSVNKSVSDA
jgi:hypothetical protein